MNLRDAVKQDDILDLLLALLDAHSFDRTPEKFTGHVVLLFSPNDITLGNSVVWKCVDGVLFVPREVRNLLRRFPLGTVSIITPGHSRNFGYSSDRNFEVLAEPYTEVYVQSGHPVYNPEFVYDTMIGNYWESKASTGNRGDGTYELLKNPDGSQKYNRGRDIHFEDVAMTY